MLESKLSICTGIVLFIFISIIMPASSEEITSPLFPTLYVDGAGGIELYWFYPETHKLNVGNNTIIPDRGVYPSKTDRQYSIFTTINLSPPYYIENVNTFIRNQDMFPDLPGNQFSPIRLAVKEKISENYYEDIWFEYVHLNEDGDFAGENVAGDADMVIDDLFDIYLALEWLSGTPTSPMVGVNSFPPYYYQTFCPMDDSSFQAIYTILGAMVGADILLWYPIDTANSDKINYEVLFSAEREDLYANGEMVASVETDTLKASFDLTTSGFLTIKAISAIGVSYSDIIYFDYSNIPPVNIAPQNILLNKSTNNNILIENIGTSTLELTIKYDASLILLSDSSLTLEAGVGKELIIQQKDNLDLFSPFCSPIIIQASGDYYPQIIYAEFSNNSPTAIEDSDLLIPVAFDISQPYPNPFNSSVRFDLVSSNRRVVQVEIYNLLGQDIFSEKITFYNRQSFTWHGLDNTGREVGTGLYFVRFSDGENVIIRKALLLK